MPRSRIRKRRDASGDADEPTPAHGRKQNYEMPEYSRGRPDSAEYSRGRPEPDYSRGRPEPEYSRGPSHHQKMYKRSSESMSSLSSASGDYTTMSFDKPRKQVENLCRAIWVSFLEQPYSTALVTLPYTLYLVSLAMHLYQLDKPRAIVFDELRYGKMISMYLNNTFFFDNEPPLGKLFLTLTAYMTGYDGKFQFSKIGAEYSAGVPIWFMRALPAVLGSAIPSFAFEILQEIGCRPMFCIFGAVLLLFDNAILVQTKFMFVEGMLLPMLMLSVFSSLKFVQLNKRNPSKWFSPEWFAYLVLTGLACGITISTRYLGWMTLLLVISMIFGEFWLLMPMPGLTSKQLSSHFIARAVCVVVLPLTIYVSVFGVHLSMLYKAGPGDQMMSSAFQASLQGGLSAVVQGQPLEVADGSQITLRHTNQLPTCWLHSHQAVYPVRYADGRGSSHQQQVTCHSEKDVNNWWIVKYPDILSMASTREFIRPIRDGDLIHLIHGSTKKPLNSHDVAAPLSKSSQEVSCYIDYNVGEVPQDLWKVEIANKATTGYVWKTILSEVRLRHVDTGTALKATGLYLPDWGYQQMEVVTDRVVLQDATIWNVEEHRYSWAMPPPSSSPDQTEPLMVSAPHRMGFWSQFFELQRKMLTAPPESRYDHKYSSHPLEWPFMTRNVAYWVNPTSLAQIHHIGNVFTWYCASYAVIIYFLFLTFYIFRQRRAIYDIPHAEWLLFQRCGLLFFVGYLIHYLPCFFTNELLFLYHYMPALIFKMLLFASFADHVHALCQQYPNVQMLICSLCVALMAGSLFIFIKLLPLSYGNINLSPENIQNLQWKDTWDFIKVQHRFFLHRGQDGL